MNNPMRTFGSKVVSTTADVISAPSRAASAIRGGIADFKRTQTVGTRNFNNRENNQNYYRGMGYWAKNKN